MADTSATESDDNEDWLEVVRTNLREEDASGPVSYKPLDSLSIRIDEVRADRAQESIANLVPEPFNDFYPSVIISYGTGYRSSSKDYPGKLIVAGVVHALFQRYKIPCYTDLMTPGGRNWEEYRLRLHSKQTGIMVLLMTRAFFRSVWCLEEVKEALDENFIVLPVRVEATSARGVDISRDEESMWPDEALQEWVCEEEWDGSNVRDEAMEIRLNDLKLARIAVVGKIMNVASIPAHATLLLDPSGVLEQLAKRIRDIVTNKTSRDDVDNVIGAYFAVQCLPSKLLRNLDGRPEMLHDLDTIYGDIENEYGNFDRDYKIYLTDGTELASALLSFKIRILIWCGRGIDECGDSPENVTIETISAAYSPEVVIVCMQYGARHIAERLGRALHCTSMIWIGMNPFEDLVMLSKAVFLPFCSSYLQGVARFEACAEALLRNVEEHIDCSKCGCVTKNAIEAEHIVALSTHRRVRALTPVTGINQRFNVTLNWDRSLKQLKVDQGDLQLYLKDLKMILSPAHCDEHQFICFTPQSKQYSSRSRALALSGCLDMCGKFHGGIYRVAHKLHKDLRLAGRPRHALVWVDFIRQMDNPFDNAHDLVSWIDGLGQNLTATVLLTADANSLEHLQSMVAQLQALKLRVKAKELADKPTQLEIPVNNLVGSFAIRALDEDRNVVALLDLPNVNSFQVRKAIKDEIFLPCQMEGEDMFDGRLYSNDDGSVWVRFFVCNVRCLTMLRDMVLLGKAAKQLAAALDISPNNIEFDLTSMAKVFESMIMQLETLTMEQQMIMTESEALLKDKKSLHIQGTAGTGKTFLALNIVLNYIEDTKGNVLYICGRHSTALHFCKWISCRIGPRDVNDSLGKVLLLLTDEQVLCHQPEGILGNISGILQGGKQMWMSSRIFGTTFDASCGVLIENEQSEVKWKDLGLVVIDEAHNVFTSDSGNALKKILSMKSKSQLILLSDPSQASVGEVQYPKHRGSNIPVVVLTEVCRCTKHIVLGARSFQIDCSKPINFSHDSNGTASMAILFPPPLITGRVEAYANNIWGAIVDILKRFPGLDMHHRLAIAIPDEKCREDFCCKVQRKLDSEYQKYQMQQRLVVKKSVDLFCARRNCGGHESHIVLDSVDNMAGLEFLIVLGVDLDSSLTDGTASARLAFSRIFRTITRAQLMFYLINIQVKNGLCDFLASAKEERDGFGTEKFSFQEELSKFEPDAMSVYIGNHHEQDKASVVTRTSLIKGLVSLATRKSCNKITAGGTVDGSIVVTEGFISERGNQAGTPRNDERIMGEFPIAAWKASKTSTFLEKNEPLYNPLKVPHLCYVLRGHTGYVTCCAIYANDTRVISGSCDKSLKVLDLTNGQELFTLEGHTDKVTCYANDTRVISGSCDKSLKVWDLTNGQELFTLEGHTDKVTCCVVYVNDTRAISGSADKMLKVWDLTNGQELFSLQGHTDAIKCCAVYANDTRVISGSADQTLKVWDLTNGQELFTFDGHTSLVMCCAVYDNDMLVISGSADRTLKVWDLINNREILPLLGHTDWVRCCAVFANGNRVISGSDNNTLKVWDLTNGQELFTLKGHTDNVTCCAVYAKDTQAISGSWDNTLRVWDLTDGQELFTLKGHTSGVNCCAVYANDTRAISGGFDGTLRVWSLPSNKPTHTDNK